MKKYLFSALAMGLMLTSCQSDEPFALGEGGEKQVTFTLNVPCELGTRATTGNNSELGGFSNNQGVTRYYTLVLEANGDTQILKQSNATTTATFTPTVVLGRNYTITAYASLDDNGLIDEKADIEAISVQKNFNDETKDAYFHTTTHNFANGDLETLSLKRPFGKLRLLATDYNVTDNAKPITDVKSVTIEYISEIPNQFDAVDGIFDNEVQIAAYTYAWTKNGSNYENYYSMTDGAMPLFADYIPANGGDNPTSFKVTVTYGNNETYSRTFNDIPVRRNALTTLKGNFFTAGAEITVKVEDAFDNSEAENITFATTAKQFIDAVNAVEDDQVITLSDDIKFSENARTLNSGSWYDGLYYIGDKSFTIDLNGKTISQDGSVNDYLLNFKNAPATNTRSAGSKANTITIKNGTIDAGTAAYCALCTSSVQENQLTINLENVTLINKNSNGSTVKVRGGAILNVKEGTKIIGNDSYLGIEATGTNTEVNIYDGAEIYMNGTSSYNGCLVGVGGNGTINVKGGYGKGVKGGFIAMTSGGTINVSGGEWIANTDGTIGDNSNLYVLTAQSNKNESGFAGPSVINVTDGTFRGGMDAWVLNNLPEEQAELIIKGGNFNADPTRYLDEGCSVNKENDIYTVAGPAAKVGNTKYATIDDAIAGWTHNTTLTLLSDVTLSDVVTLKSTEHHILNLGTYTMTAADKKNAIEISPYGEGAGTAAKSCLTINADADNPGGINAGSKACIYYKKTNGINDRIMVTINGGIFDGTISSSSNNGGQACPYFVFNGGVFNKSVNLTKAMLKVTGGIFHGMFSCTGDSTAHRLISGGTFKSFTFMTADAATKFTIGTDKQVYNVGLYINDEGYLVVGGPVITEFGDKFVAKATNATMWSSYLKYSSAAANGLYYTNADKAIEKHGAANVVLK